MEIRNRERYHKQICTQDIPSTATLQYRLLVAIAGQEVHVPVRGSYLSTLLRQDAPSYPGSMTGNYTNRINLHFVSICYRGSFCIDNIIYADTLNFLLYYCVRIYCVSFHVQYQIALKMTLIKGKLSGKQHMYTDY